MLEGMLVAVAFLLLVPVLVLVFCPAYPSPRRRLRRCPFLVVVVVVVVVVAPLVKGGVEGTS